MAELRCKECNVFLGEMIKGSIHKRASVLCEKCMKRFETYKSLSEQQYNKLGSKNVDVPDFLQDLLKGQI